MNTESKLAFLEKILGKFKFSSSTHEAEFFCPLCSHHKPKLSINLLTDKWRCWVCGKNGKKLLFILKESGCSKSQLEEYISKFKSDEVLIQKYNFEEENFSLKLPKEYIPIVCCEKSILGKISKDYLINKRGICEEDILKYKIGVMPDKSIVFPSFNKTGNLNMFTNRLHGGQYYNPWTPKGYKNSIILNELNVDWKKPVVIVEGFVDMLKSIRNTIPLFGSSFNYDSLLFEEIVKNSSEVVLALDPDAWKRSDNIAKNLSRYDLSVYTVDIGNYKDVGEMTKEQFVSIYEKRKLWTSEDSLIQKLRKIV